MCNKKVAQLDCATGEIIKIHDSITSACNTLGKPFTSKISLVCSGGERN